MSDPDADRVWTRKGATLSHKVACKEFGLTEKEIVAGINAGKLRFCERWMYGNPYLVLVRSEVEAWVAEQHGADRLQRQKLQAELDKVNKELRALKVKAAKLEKRKAELVAALGAGG